MNTKVLLVDDHPMLCSGLRQELSRQPGLDVVGQAGSGAEALRLACQLAPDLVVMDYHLPDEDGVVITRKILEVLRTVKVLIFSTDASQSQIDEALRAGACGYVLKSSAVTELIQAIQRAMEGRLYVSEALRSGILESYRQSLQPQSAPTAPGLSEKEKQLLRLLAAGQRSKEIAAQLNLSLSSVDTYRTRIRQKLGCDSSADLIRYAIVHKIADA